jgi:hypothetical protein
MNWTLNSFFPPQETYRIVLHATSTTHMYFESITGPAAPQQFYYLLHCTQMG